MAAIISIEDWESNEKLLQKLEEEENIREAKIALKEVEEKRSISFDGRKRRIGL